MAQYCAEGSYGLAIISEPYAVSDSALWFGDETGAAIWWNPVLMESPCFLLGRGRGFVAVGCGDSVYVSCYLSPNTTIEEYVNRLEEIARFGEEQGDVLMIIAGDFNVRSVIWGDHTSNRRSALVHEMAATLDLRLANVGDESTCHRAQGHSVVDLTWAFPSMVRRIWRWEPLRHAVGSCIYMLRDGEPNIPATGSGGAYRTQMVPE